MTNMIIRKLAMSTVLAGGLLLAPTLSFAEDDQGSVTPPDETTTSDDGTGHGTDDGGLVDDGVLPDETIVDESPVDDGGVVDGGVVDGGDGEVTITSDGEPEYDPVIAQSGVPQVRGDKGVGKSSFEGSSGDTIWPVGRKQGARRSLFGSNSPLREWLAD